MLRRSIRVALPAILAALAAVVITLVFTVFHGTSSAATLDPRVGPVDVSGNWHQTKSGIPGAVMDAHISDGKIRIDVTMSGSTNGMYWQGTFDTATEVVKKFSVTSIGDTSAMADSMYASQDSAKTFTYDNGDLSFPYSIMGVSTVVHLTRS